MDKSDKIYVAGHKGLVGSAILRTLETHGFANILCRDSSEIDLRNFEEVQTFFAVEKPDYVFLAAAKVGGINANMTFPADFLLDNLMIQNSVIKACMTSRVKKLCFLGSSCIYPCECPQPMREDYLMTGPLEPTNEGYALAKIAGLKLVKFFNQQYGLQAICPMPCNIYGPGDSFDLAHSHVLSALVRKFCEAKVAGAKKITLWGSGVARREFLHANDLARGLLFLMEKHSSPDIINIGSGKDISIRELAEIIATETGYQGKICWDATKPDGMLRKCLDISKISAMGFSPEISLKNGIRKQVEEFRQLMVQSRKNSTKEIA